MRKHCVILRDTKMAECTSRMICWPSFKCNYIFTYTYCTTCAYRNSLFRGKNIIVGHGKQENFLLGYKLPCGKVSYTYLTTRIGIGVRAQELALSNPLTVHNSTSLDQVAVGYATSLCNHQLAACFYLF